MAKWTKINFRRENFVGTKKLAYLFSLPKIDWMAITNDINRQYYNVPDIASSVEHLAY